MASYRDFLELRATPAVDVNPLFWKSIMCPPAFAEATAWRAEHLEWHGSNSGPWASWLKAE